MPNLAGCSRHPLTRPPPRLRPEPSAEGGRVTLAIFEETRRMSEKLSDSKNVANASTRYEPAVEGPCGIPRRHRSLIPYAGCHASL